jgi:DNA-directed RNA polymerase sigma subunit (sigma70/sigma32)
VSNIKKRDAEEIERKRQRWRAFLVPHWKRLSAEVLTRQERVIVDLRLGITSNTPLTYAAIGRRFDRHPYWIAELERRALAKIRAALQLEASDDAS